MIFARVHDSRIAGNPDFGPGWRLSLAEELHAESNAIVHIDRAGARHRFKENSGSYVADPPLPQHAGSSLTFAADGKTATLEEADGTKRVFEQSHDDANRYRIALVETASRALHFRYKDGLLDAILAQGATLFRIRRGGDGGGRRIVEVADLHGRAVRYSYTAEGKLKDVIDPAGNVWWHQYDAAGRLAAAVGANGRPYLEVGYDADGRVIESRTGREYRFAYGMRQTIVTEGTGRKHAFDRNDAGITVALASPGGANWNLRLDTLNRVEQLSTPNTVLRYHYAGGDLVETAMETQTGGTRARYAYDAAGRLTGVESDSGEWTSIAYADGHVHLSGHASLAYDLSDDGRVTAVRDGDAWINAERDAGGALTALFRGTQAAYFDRDATGRIIGTRYPSRNQARYFHDALGNRQLAEYEGGRTVRYRHDAAGNIVQVDVANADGTTQTQRVTVGDMNRLERIEYEGSHTLRVRYDAMGRPVEFDAGEDVVAVLYDAHGALARLVSKKTGAEWAPDAAPAAAPRRDRRRTILSGDPAGRSQPDYGPVAFSDGTFEALPLEPLELGVPGLPEARDVLAVARPLFSGAGDSAMRAFEKASNPVFQPPEYAATNCCVPQPGSESYCSPWKPDPGEEGGSCGGVTKIEYPGTDPHPLDIAGLTPGTRAAMQCLIDKVAANGGKLMIASAYRPRQYQKHLREVWDKYQIVKDWEDGKCVEVRDNIEAEWVRHNIRYRPATNSRHSLGIAFDATSSGLDAGADIDDLAHECGLARPIKGDTVHFEYQ